MIRLKFERHTHQIWKESEVKQYSFVTSEWGSESPASCTTFSRLPYFCAPLPPDSHLSLSCSRFRFQVNQEDQKPGFDSPILLESV